MPAHNAEKNLNDAQAAGNTVVTDFGAEGLKMDVIAESTSAAGVTIDSVILKDGGVTSSGTTVRSGGDKTLAIALPNADTTILAANSGKIHHVPNVSANRTYTLPSASEGLYYEFSSTLGAADGNDWIIVADDASEFLIGGVLFVDSDIAGSTSEVILSAPDNSSDHTIQVILPSVGTWLKFYCNGTNWFLSGMVFSTTAPTYT